MSVHPAPRSSLSSLSYEEKLALLEERSASYSESEGDHGSSDMMARLRDLTSSPPRFVDNLRQMPDAPSLVKGVLRASLSTSWRRHAVRALVFLVPSFLQHYITGEKRSRSERLGSTAYLDGMRGLAALFVYFCHYTYQCFVIAEGWGSKDTNYDLLKLPFLRFWYQGPPMVCVFFVISGYALSLKPLKQMRSNAWDGFAGTMSSMTFRRGIRLFLPTAVSTLMIVLLLRLGAYERTRDFANNRTYMKNVVEPHPFRLASLGDQLQEWAHEMFIFVQVFRWDIYSAQIDLDIHLWTIPVEFRCSMYLFLVIFGTARLRTWIRMSIVLSITLFTWNNLHWELVLFFCGMMIAELDLIRGAHDQPASLPSPSGSLLESPILSEKQSTRPGSREKIKRVYWSLFCIGALYLMNQPDAMAHITPGWVFLESLIPEWWDYERYRYWQSVGSVLFVYGVGHSAGWQRFFNSSVVQYFGKISYAIYLMHGLVTHTAGYTIERWAYGITGIDGWWFNAGFVLGFLFSVPTVVWAADLFWRAVDIPSVKFARWVEAKCLRPIDGR